jgi:hypothetical protein
MLGVAMLVSAILAVALLFCVSGVVLAAACRPALSLNLSDTSSATGENRQRHSGSEGENGVEYPVSKLSEEDREGFFQVWLSVREEFDADPRATVRRADLLVSDLIDVGCPRTRRDSAGSMLADTPLRSKYWRAHEIAVRSKDGCAQPNELKRAIRLYTVLFDELLGVTDPPRIADRPTRAKLRS